MDQSGQWKTYCDQQNVVAARLPESDFTPSEVMVISDNYSYRSTKIEITG